MHPFLLTNQVALITGASKGIGFSMAEYFAAAGAKVVISSRDQPTLDLLAAELQKRVTMSLALPAMSAKWTLWKFWCKRPSKNMVKSTY